MIRTGLRALVWLLASAGLLLAGFALLGALLMVPTLVDRGHLPDALGWANLSAVYSAIAAQALLPELGLTVAGWLALAFVWPAPERSRGGLALGLLGVALLWFPLVAEKLFTVWHSTGADAYAATWLLVAGGAAAAAWAARLLPGLEPGCFAAPRSRDIVMARD